MLQYIDKKKNFLFLLLILFFLSSINSQLFVKKKESFYNLNSIEVVGLDEKLNLEIEQNLNFLKNTNIFFIDSEILKDQIGKYKFIENYNIFKFYPSKIILKLQQTDFLAKTIRNNEVFIIGSNRKFISGKKFNKYNDLPFVYGKFTAEKFILFINMINKSNLNYKNIQEIFFFPSGRIDVKTKNNLLIKFPLKNLEEALIRVDKIINSKIFNNNIIDLRVSNQLIMSNE